ncbi:hypothetical protein R3P38DRAFT_2808985 [Favolaschia claudopus]|uniref:Uncharacterized protein n=1 Tax=Favolaschia claudopus TaxID=2862362 RepID=A0AAV9ZFC8_9AGAR
MSGASEYSNEPSSTRFRSPMQLQHMDVWDKKELIRSIITGTLIGSNNVAKHAHLTLSLSFPLMSVGGDAADGYRPLALTFWQDLSASSERPLILTGTARPDAVRPKWRLCGRTLPEPTSQSIWLYSRNLLITLAKSSITKRRFHSAGTVPDQKKATLLKESSLIQFLFIHHPVLSKFRCNSIDLDAAIKSFFAEKYRVPRSKNVVAVCTRPAGELNNSPLGFLQAESNRFVIPSGLIDVMNSLPRKM